MRGWPTLVMLAVAVPLPMRAQRIAPPSIASPLLVHARTALPVGPGRSERTMGQTHWKTGFVVGTIFGTAFWFAAVAAGGGDNFSPRDAIVSVGLGALVGGVPGALIGGLVPKGDTQGRVIRGPAPNTAAAVLAPAPAPTRKMNLRPSSSSYRRSANWKGGVLLGAFAGTIFGVMVATQAGDEGSERPFSDRLSDGVVAGAMLAVPVTVIFAMLAGEGE